MYKDDLLTRQGRVYTAKAQLTLLVYLQDYVDVFSVENASVLLAYSKLDYAIDITPNTEPLYGPLYNLLQSELAVLQDYLEESTNKGWIWRSTSLVGALVLFAPKKDRRL